MPNTVTGTTVTAVAEDTNANVSISPSPVVNLNVGANVITVTVTAENGTVKVYTVTVNREKSANANLSSLVLSDVSISFSVANTSYTVDVPNTVTSTTVTAVAEDTNANVSISPSPVVNLNVGANVITVTVTAENGTVKVYTVTVNREKSANANLSSLVLSDVSISFSVANTSYTVDVPNTVTSTTVTAVAEDTNANVSISPSPVVNLNVGANVITVTVTAENGTVKVYTVTVNREKSANANLSSLVLSDVSISFSAANTSYTADVPNTVTSTTVTAVAEDTNANVSISPSPVVNLNVGANVITVTVTAENGTVKVYTVTVNRERNKKADLSSLVLRPVDITNFSADEISYTVDVKITVTQITVTAAAEDPNASVEISPPSPVEDLEVGENEITITVTVENLSRTYTVIVNVKPTDSLLSDISLPSGFSISYYSNKVPKARSLALGSEGTLFVGTRDDNNIYALVDENDDNYAEVVYEVANNISGPNGVAFKDGDLYVAQRDRIIRYVDIEDYLSSPPTPQVVISMLPAGSGHWWKFLGFGPDGKLYVSSGAPCNVCESENEQYATILRMDSDGTDLEVFAHGVRNTVGFDWHPDSDDLWFTDNGRDNISTNTEINDNSPPDELNRADSAGLDFGFPYCHGEDVMDPDFGSEDNPCDGFTAPQWELPAHVAPLGMRFYTGSMFPASWENVIFIAEHGSWNRSTPVGYRVTSVKLDEDGEASSYEVFAEGWLENDGTAWGRPVDVLVASDGALLVSDDRKGAVYRIFHSP